LDRARDRRLCHADGAFDRVTLSPGRERRIGLIVWIELVQALVDADPERVATKLSYIVF
jgi:hypothetical protein